MHVHTHHVSDHSVLCILVWIRTKSTGPWSVLDLVSFPRDLAEDQPTDHLIDQFAKPVSKGLLGLERCLDKTSLLLVHSHTHIDTNAQGLAHAVVPLGACGLDLGFFVLLLAWLGLEWLDSP